MRQPQYTITPRHVHAHAIYLIQKHVRLRDHGPKCRAGVLWTVLLYAAARIVSLAAACASLRDAPSDTAVHDALLAGLPPFAELQRRLNHLHSAISLTGFVINYLSLSNISYDLLESC